MEINLRYIAVSATVPNLQDIATWLTAKRKCIHNFTVYRAFLNYYLSHVHSNLIFRGVPSHQIGQICIWLSTNGG